LLVLFLFSFAFSYISSTFVVNKHYITFIDTRYSIGGGNSATYQNSAQNC